MTVRVETLGSVWIFRETEHFYLRLPKSEAGRRRPEYGDHRAPPGLQDRIWHAFSYWGITAAGVEDLALTIVDLTGRTVCNAPDPDLSLAVRHWCPAHPDPPPLWLDQSTYEERVTHVRAYVNSLPEPATAADDPAGQET